ncbi:MAG: hypothetical protein KF764_05750 [Labilithrix sp.]|nr:hypothetical protein [Labilithrix sp.]
MRYPTFRILGISSLVIAAIHCDPDPSPSDPNTNVPDGGEPPSVDAAPGDASPDAGPSDTCGALQKFERNGGPLEASETWPVGDYLVKGTLYLKGTLTIPACTVLRLAPDANIVVDTGGALKLLGGETTKVRVTSSNTTPSAGDWGYIEFRASSSSADSEIHHSVIEHGGKGYGAIFVASSASVAIDHTTIQNSATYGVEVRSGGHLRGFTDNVITTSGTAPVKIHVNSVGDLLGGTYTGNASDVISVDGGNVDKTATWRNLGIPYRADTFYVKGSATPQKLTLAAGVTLQMRPSQSINVGTAGGLTLAGTAAAPVKITSSETSPSAGDWGYIEFRSDSTAGDNVIEHAIVEYGGQGYGAIYVAASASVKITDSTVRHSEDVGLQVVSDTSALRGFTGNTFTDNAQGHIRARANVIGQIGAGTYTSGGVNDVIRVDGGTVSKNATWGAWGVPYRVDATVYVQAPSGTATLTVAAGARLAMGNGITFIADTRGLLNLAGTAASHVTVTSAAAAPVMGIWNYIEIRSLGNAFSYADISYGGGGGNATGFGQLYVAASSSVALDHVNFSNGLLCDVDRANSTNATVNATDTTFTACPL